MPVDVEVITEIAAPPAKVWRALTDFARYPDWNPYREIQGAPGLGQRVIQSIGPDPKARLKLPAKICVFEPGREIAFRTGRWWTGWAWEIYRLEPTARGTRLHHAAESPWIGVLLSGGRERFQARLTQVYTRVDAALAKHLSSQSSTPMTVRGALRRRR